MNLSKDRRVALGQLPPMGSLIAFESVARNQSLSRAMSELGLTKSALTHSIAMLEHRLKLRLVNRYSPMVVLTRVGQSYFASSQAFARNLRDDHYLQSATATTQIRISTSRGLGRLWLGPRLNQFSQAHPRIELIISTADRLESVLGDGVDIGLRYGGPTIAGMLSVPMWEDTLVAVGNAQLARQTRFLSVAEALTTLPLVEWAAWAAGLIPTSLRAQPRITTVDLHFAAQCALAGVGLAILPRRLVQRHIKDGTLECVFAHATPSKPYHAVVSQEQSQRVPMRLLLDWIAEQVAIDSEVVA
jgi:DNA-binding transcriptional LysR family regulator